MMYCNKCGQQVADTDNYCSKCGAPMARPATVQSVQSGDSREDVLAAICQTLLNKPGLTLVRGQKTDIEISSTLADANWQVGRKKVTYSACVLADVGTRTIVFWEMIKETGSGLGSFFSFKKETYSSDGRTRSGTVKETAYGPDGKIIDYEWDYSQVRNMVQDVARAHGWQFKTVLLKGKATY